MVKRAILIFIALLFLITSLGFSGLVIWQMRDESRRNKETAALQKTIQNAQNKPKEGALQGTKLTGFTPVAKIDSLQKIDLTAGTGSEVKAGNKVTVNYTGAVASTGVIFQSSLDSGQPASFGLNQVIKGWTDGIPGMKVGGKRRLLIPADQAYGANPPQGSGIPANANLVFDVEMLNIGE